MAATYCKNCGYHIVLVPFSTPTWMHQPPGAAFQDNMSQYCRTTAAEPGVVFTGPFHPDHIDPRDRNGSNG